MNIAKREILEEKEENQIENGVSASSPRSIFAKPHFSIRMRSNNEIQIFKASFVYYFCTNIFQSLHYNTEKDRSSSRFINSISLKKSSLS